MATRISDALDHRRTAARAAGPAAYSGKGAGLYSEVAPPPAVGPAFGQARAAPDDPQPAPTT
jgi:hypothetical protein